MSLLNLRSFTNCYLVCLLSKGKRRQGKGREKGGERHRDEKRVDRGRGTGKEGRENLYLFSIAAITNNPKFSGLKKHKFILF